MLWPIGLLANDATVGGQGADLVLLDESRIRMVSEDIRLVQKERGMPEWIVYAHYVFHNPTADSVHVRMGFPEMEYDRNVDYDTYDPRFRDLQTRVGGYPVEHSRGTLREGLVDFRLGTVYVFEVAFGPGERVVIDHRYEYSGSSDVMGVRADYVTRTGSLWNGPIEKATFTVAVAGLPSRIAWPAEYNMIGQYRDRFPTDPAGTVRSVYIFQQTDWIPTNDFSVGMYLWYDASLPDCCPQGWSVDEILAASDPSGALREEAECLPTDSIRLCRNAVFARYGRPFTDSALTHYFYPPLRSGGLWGPDDESDVPMFSIGLQPNPRYSDDLLSDADRELVVLLKRLEEERLGAALGGETNLTD